MRERGDPRRWPAAVGLALGLTLAVAFWLPRSWLAFVLPTGRGVADLDPGDADRWRLQVMPPIEVWTPARPEAPPPPPPDPTPYQDPQWWLSGRIVGAAADPALFAPTVAAPDDTLDLLLGALELGADLMTRARPDSLLAARLFELRLEEGFRFDDLKPYLTHLSRAAAYADMMSRVADMYGDHLRQEIQVPD